MARSDWAALARHLAFVLAAIVCAVMFGRSVAQAHEWFPLSCCSEQDCMVVPPDALRVTTNGWQIVATGEVVGWGDARLRQTPTEGEGQYAWCRHLRDKPATAWSAPIKAGTTICLFVPPGGV